MRALNTDQIDHTELALAEEPPETTGIYLFGVSRSLIKNIEAFLALDNPARKLLNRYASRNAQCCYAEDYPDQTKIQKAKKVRYISSESNAWDGKKGVKT